MAKINISKDIIKNVAQQNKKHYIQQVNLKVMTLMNTAIKELSSKISFISSNNVIIQPMNELLTGAFIDNSTFTYFLGINNPQLDMNTQNNSTFWKNFKNRLLLAWQNRSSFSRRRKRKRDKKNAEKPVNINYDVTKYNLYSLGEDLQNTIIKYLADTSLVFLYDNRIEIIGKDDFGANTKIIIYLSIYNGEIFKLFTGKKKKYIEINVKKRLEAIKSKYNDIGDTLIQILKIFNYLYYNVNNMFFNQIFIESIICSCPNNYFEGRDIYQIFLKIINYFSIQPLNEITSIVSEKSIFKEPLCQGSGIGFNRMMNSLVDNKNLNG